MAGAAHGLQNRCGAEKSRVGSTPIHLRHQPLTELLMEDIYD